MTEEVLLNSGYKYFKDEHPRCCNRFYQKKLSGYDDENTKCINVYYYDRFGPFGELGYSFEYELYEEKNNYAMKKLIYGINKDRAYTIEEIENLLLGDD